MITTTHITAHSSFDIKSPFYTIPPIVTVVLKEGSHFRKATLESYVQDPTAPRLQKLHGYQREGGISSEQGSFIRNSRAPFVYFLHYGIFLHHHSDATRNSGTISNNHN